MNELENSVHDDIMFPYMKAIPTVIEHTLRTEEVINLYKFITFKGFGEFIDRLNDYIVIIATELFVNALYENGVSINDHPCYRDMMGEFLRESGISFEDEMFEVVDDALVEISQIMYSQYGNTSEVYILVEFLKVAAKYTNVKFVVAKVYSIIAKNYSIIINENNSIDDAYTSFGETYSAYGDMIDLSSISDSIPMYTELVLEYVSNDISKAGLFDETFLSFIDKADIDIYKLLLQGDADEDTL